jgi:hypothetical protein
MNNCSWFFQNSHFQAISLRWRYSIFISSFTLLSFGCTTAPAPRATLDIQVQPGGRSGLYAASGTTNLPDQSRLIVMAIRPLRSASQLNQAENKDGESNYAILDRRAVEVKQGQWQTNLNLWQVAPNGQFQESWQLNQAKLGTNFTPSSEVTFVATFDPVNQSPAIEPQINQALEIESPVVRFTNDGERYLQASETVSLSLPTGKTTPPALTATDLNHGWGDRSGPAPDLTADKQRSPVSQSKLSQTDAPLTADQMLR